MAPTSRRPSCGGILVRRDTHRPLERPLEVMGAHAKARTKLGQCDPLLIFAVQELAYFFYQARAVRLLASRVAAQAGSKTGRLGEVRCVEEDDTLACRTPRGARGPAVDLGGKHRADERPVVGGIARQHRFPALVVFDSCSRRHFHFCNNHHVTSTPDATREARTLLSGCCLQSHRTSRCFSGRQTSRPPLVILSSTLQRWNR